MTGPLPSNDRFDLSDPTYELTLDANAKIWARVAVNMEVYDADVAMVSVGATGFVQAHLFGYAGNGCGDLDGDGEGDTIEDLLLDLDVGYLVDVRLRGLLLPDQDRPLIDGLRHLYFWDLWEDGEGWNVTDPLIIGPDQGEAGHSLRYEFAARPCYPYVDDLTLQWSELMSGTGSLAPRTGTLGDSIVPNVVGTHNLVVTAVSDTHGRELGTSTSMSVTVTHPGGGGDGGGQGTLINNVAKTGLSSPPGSRVFFTLDVPSGATDLRFDLSGGSGDADLYVLLGRRPGLSTFDCRSWNSDNDESCSFPSPQVGRYHVLVYGFDSYSDASLVASYTEPAGDGGDGLANGVPETDLSGATGSDTFYTVDVPAGATDLTFELSDGSGDADLYVRFGSAPTTSDYDCRSWNSDNGERCTIPSPQVGTYHVLIHGFAAYSGATLVASYSEPSSCGESSRVGELAVPAGNQLRYTFDVEACATSVTLTLSGGTGDADLYVRFGAQPSTSTFDCRSWSSDSDEVCTFTSAQAGTYHIMVHAYSAFSDVTLEASYE